MIETQDDGLGALAPMEDTKLPTGPGVAAVALAMAMKFHDINTIQDGTLYQQYKLEGKNMTPLHIDQVFETAIRIELHLMAGSDRIANMVIDAVVAAADEEESSRNDPDHPKRRR